MHPTFERTLIPISIQQQKGFELIKCICDTYNIPKRAGDANGGIIRHADIDPVNRARCPGAFNFDALWNYLSGGTTPVSQQPTAQQDAEARLCWASFFVTIGQKPPATGTGIFTTWLSDWVNHGKQYGPPITHEYDSSDWNGNHIVCQEFAHARCEWSAGSELGMVLTARFRGGSCQLKSNFLRSLHKKTLASLTNSSTTCQSTTWMSGDMLRYHVVLMDSKLMCRRSTTQSAVFTIAAWRGLTMPYERLSGKSPMKERRCVKM